MDKVTMEIEEIPGAPDEIMFSDLPDNCIESICARLPLDDLCSFSLTCKRVHKEASRQFYFRYKDHQMEIVNTLGGPQVKAREPYVKCFKSKIRNIKITSDYCNLGLTSLFTFIRIECCENLLELEFDSINLRSKQQYGKLIKAQLAKLTTISFINCSNCDIRNGFLKYCKSLQHLVVKEAIDTKMDCTWMSHVYPKLESFVYYVPSTDSTELLTFFQLNSHLKRLACSNDQIISYISDLGITLDFLLFQIRSPELLADSFEILKHLCGSKQVHRLKLEFSGWFSACEYPRRVINDLVSFGSALDALLFESSQLKLTLHHPLTNHRFDNIKYLSLGVTKPITSSILRRIALKLPNLEEIHPNSWLNAIFIEHFQYSVGALVSVLKNLRTIAIHRIDAKDIAEDSIEQMNDLRKDLEDAVPLTVHLPYEIIQNVKFRISFGSLVFVEPISSLERDMYILAI